MTKLSPRPVPKPKAALRVLGAIRLSLLSELREDEFENLAALLEQDPLFKKLRDRGVIRNARLPNAGWAYRFDALEADKFPGANGTGYSEFLADNRGLLDVVRGIGPRLFERYFLYREHSLPPEELAEACGITPGLARDLERFVDSWRVIALTAAPRGRGPEAPAHSRVASVRREGRRFELDYASLAVARGVYALDRTRLESLRERGDLDSRDRGRLDRLLRTVELLNERKSSLHRVLEHVLAKQRAFLLAEDPGKLLPFSQKEAASDLDMPASRVCRLLARRSLLLPWGEEQPLKFLFPSRRTVGRRWVRALLATRPGSTDEELRRMIQRRYGINVSRRTVNLYAQGSRR
ncbi:hypothetical protein ACFL2T_02860 [Elusimicrobiota bacterium]